MKTRLAILFACLVCSISFAGYKELEDLKQSSCQAVRRYAQRLGAEDPKSEGVVKFGEALNEIENPAKMDVAKLTLQSKPYWRAVLEMTPP